MNRLASLRSVLIALLSGAILFLADLTSKASLFFPEDTRRDTAWRLVRLTAHKNEGISFNIPVPLGIIIAIAVVAGTLLLILAARTETKRWTRLVGLGFILGGALGNAYDRLSFGFVRDWLLFLELSAINVADAGIILGLILCWWEQKRTRKK